MAERGAALLLRDRAGAIALTSTSTGVHLGEADDLPRVELTAEDHVAADTVGASPIDFATARALARLGVPVASAPLELRESAYHADRFAEVLRENSASIVLPPSRTLGAVRGRGDVLAGESLVREFQLDSEVAGLSYQSLATLRAGWSDGTRLPSQPLARALASLDVGGLRDAGIVVDEWEVTPGLRMIPIETPTLPPATHTNSFLIGTKHLVLVEPASPYPEEIERLVARVLALREDGYVLDALVLTHHHPDHVGGAMALRERLSVPIIGHERTAQRLEGSVVLDRLVGDGDVIRIDGPKPFELQLLHTPGHAPGHLCLFDRRSGALIAGDMVAGVGTILVETHDGDMQLYLESLDRLRGLGATMILPAHGGVVRDPKAWLSFYIAHRLAREAKIVAALKETGAPTTIADLVPIAYADTSPMAWPLAQMASAAHLEKLVREGRVLVAGDSYSLAN